MALRPLYANPERDLRFALYRGATVDAPVDGRWSLVPALPVEKPTDRFERPRVILPGRVVNDALMMGSRPVAMDARQLADTWHQLLSSVYDADLVAATHLHVPAPGPGAASVALAGCGRPC